MIDIFDESCKEVFFLQIFAIIYTFLNYFVKRYFTKKMIVTYVRFLSGVKYLSNFYTLVIML